MPGLKSALLTSDFSGQLNLYDGAIEEGGGGVQLRVYLDHALDRVVIDLAGLPPDQPQTVRLALWAPRQPKASASGPTAMLSESWRDDSLPGRSMRAFGSLAAITAQGRDLQARVIDTRTVELQVRPQADGRLRVLIAAPAFDGTADPAQLAKATLDAPVDADAAAQAWHAFWARAYPLRAESPDGVARYMETLRTIFLYSSAAHNGGAMPGSQAGIADLFSASRDAHAWDPAAFWFWNLRMQVGANLVAGLPDLNQPMFDLYRNNLPALQAWTRRHMGGRPGICVPETMRFNGLGVEYENDEFRPFAFATHSCDLGAPASSNARTLTTGAEIGLWVWRSYLQTGDLDFLRSNYPLMAEAARFLRAYQQPGPDGLLHTNPSNAHETQHDVRDPATDIAAIRALYPAVIQAATLLGRDADLVAALKQALPLTPHLPEMDPPAQTTPERSRQASGPGPVLAPSSVTAEASRNVENIGLEAVWPYRVIGVDDPLYAVAQRTFALRPFPYFTTWSYDLVDAVRLGLGEEAAYSFYRLVQLYQVFPNGMADWGSATGEFYVEQAGVAALALSEMLAHEQGDLIRIAAAVPPHWTMAGRVALRGQSAVDVDVVDGTLTGFTLDTGAGGEFTLDTPWHGQRIAVSEDGRPVTTMNDGARIRYSAAAHRRLRFAPVGEQRQPHFAAEAEASVKSLGRASIGLGHFSVGVLSDAE